jgi:hypothetical protein
MVAPGMRVLTLIQAFVDGATRMVVSGDDGGATRAESCRTAGPGLTVSLGVGFGREDSTGLTGSVGLGFCS